MTQSDLSWPVGTAVPPNMGNDFVGEIVTFGPIPTRHDTMHGRGEAGG